MSIANAARGLVAAGLLWAVPGAPASAQLSVDVEGCGGVRAVEVAEALELELGSGPSDGLTILVVCEDASITIDVADRVTDKRISRRVAGVDAARAGAAQVIALLASELVLASWAELLMSPRGGPDGDRARARVLAEMEADAPREPEGPSTTSERATEPTSTEGPEDLESTEGAAGTESASITASLDIPETTPETSVSAAPTEPDAAPPASPPEESSAPDLPSGAPSTLTLVLSGGIHLRDVNAPFTPAFVSLRGAAALGGGWSFGVRASLEFSELGRVAGAVSYAAVGAGLVVGLEALREGVFALDLFVEARGAWARLDARPARSSIEGRALDAPLIELEGTLAPSLALDALHLAVEASFGVTAVGPIGTVTGEADVTLPGLLFGLGLAVGIR